MYYLIACVIPVFLSLLGTPRAINANISGNSITDENYTADGMSTSLAHESPESLNCDGFTLVSPTTVLTAYYSGRPGDLGDGHTFVDSHGMKLESLQDFLDNRSPFVTVSVDASLRIPYGMPVCIAAVNRHFGRRIPFEVRDTSEDLDGIGFGQIEICVETEAHSYEGIVNLYNVEVFM